ncbi:hypothetical protein B0T25DRAFT_540992 [Lasiosphaeria hispida]|uniref:Uncharacterized protein n=1 Tax=Lasiosphaeria hispida TaxID=260671 RepID=A0AAJ0HNG2_9PEZI|nr:hypothetical protein B0T25DRAFT_540992 [Lasiosphaeria hispida]
MPSRALPHGRTERKGRKFHWWGSEPHWVVGLRLWGNRLGKPVTISLNRALFDTLSIDTALTKTARLRHRPVCGRVKTKRRTSLQKDVFLHASETPPMTTLQIWAVDASRLGANAIECPTCGAGDPAAKTSTLEHNDNDVQSEHPQPNLPRFTLHPPTITRDLTNARAARPRIHSPFPTTEHSVAFGRCGSWNATIPARSV